MKTLKQFLSESDAQEHMDSFTLKGDNGKEHKFHVMHVSNPSKGNMFVSRKGTVLLHHEHPDYNDGPDEVGTFPNDDKGTESAIAAAKKIAKEYVSQKHGTY